MSEILHVLGVFIHWFLIGIAPALLVWDTIHCNVWDVKSYLILWLVCLTVVSLLY